MAPPSTLPRTRLPWIALALGVFVLGAGAARYACSGTERQLDTVGPPEPKAPIVAWCAEGLEPVPGGGCFAPARSGTPRPAPLLVYLHGRFEHAAPKEELDRQKRVAERATARGVSVLALRGKEGQCLQPELASWVCWPASERSVDAGPSFVASWSPSLAEAEARTGKGKRYVLGFSSGGFFAVIVATRALLDADAFAIAGAGPIEPTHALGAKPPMLLLSSDDDPSQPGMFQLKDELTREGWPHDTISRDGVHELMTPDIDAALTFFVRAATEKLPLHPPLSTHVPRPHDPSAHDASMHDPSMLDASTHDASMHDAGMHHAAPFEADAETTNPY